MDGSLKTTRDKYYLYKLSLKMTEGELLTLKLILVKSKNLNLTRVDNFETRIRGILNNPLIDYYNKKVANGAKGTRKGIKNGEGKIHQRVNN